MKKKYVTKEIKQDNWASNLKRGRHGRDSMVVGSTTSYAISGYHH
jgi:hypothetical protein